jgi:hypothetical protein
MVSNEAILWQHIEITLTHQLPVISVLKDFSGDASNHLLTYSMEQSPS